MADLSDSMPLSYYTSRRSNSNSPHRSGNTPDHESHSTEETPSAAKEQDTAHKKSSSGMTETVVTTDKSKPRSKRDQIVARLQRHVYRLEKRCKQLETDLLKVNKEAGDSLMFVSELLQKMMKNEATLRAEITSIKNSQLKIDVKNVKYLTKKMKQRGYTNVDNDAEYVIVSRNIEDNRNGVNANGNNIPPRQQQQQQNIPPRPLNTVVQSIAPKPPIVTVQNPGPPMNNTRLPALPTRDPLEWTQPPGGKNGNRRSVQGGNQYNQNSYNPNGNNAMLQQSQAPIANPGQISNGANTIPANQMQNPGRPVTPHTQGHPSNQQANMQNASIVLNSNETYSVVNQQPILPQQPTSPQQVPATRNPQVTTLSPVPPAHKHIPTSTDILANRLNDDQLELSRTDAQFVQMYNDRVAAKKALNNLQRKNSALSNGNSRVDKPNWLNNQASSRIVEAKRRRHLLGEGGPNSTETNQPPNISSTSSLANNLLGLSNSHTPAVFARVGIPAPQNPRSASRGRNNPNEMDTRQALLSNLSPTPPSKETTPAQSGGNSVVGRSQSPTYSGNPLYRKMTTTPAAHNCVQPSTNNDSGTPHIRSETPSQSHEYPDFDIPDMTEAHDPTYQSDSVIEINDNSSEEEGDDDEYGSGSGQIVKGAQLVMAGPAAKVIQMYEVDHIFYTGDSPYSAISLVFYIDQKYSDIREHKRMARSKYALGFPHILLDEGDVAVQVFGGNIMTEMYLQSLEFFFADFLAQCHLLESKLMTGCTSDQWKRQHDVFMALMYWRQLSKEKRGYRGYTMLHAVKELENYRLHSKADVMFLANKYLLEKKSFLNLCQKEKTADWMFQVETELPVIGKNGVDETNINAELDKILVPPPGLTFFPYASVTSPEGIEVM